MAEDNGQTRQYLTFQLDKELFALDTDVVREVLEYTNITRVPRTSSYLRGLINLRGQPVAVVDLRRKFRMPDMEPDERTCIIIVEVEIEDEPTMIGAIADSVEEVHDLGGEDIEPPPSMGTQIKSDFIRGMSRIGDRFLSILEISRLFSLEELLEAGAVRAEAKGE